MKKILGDLEFITDDIYRGSRDGWSAKDFHSKCNDATPTITLMRVKDGPCIGGYTKHQWFPSYRPCEDKDAIIFNLTNEFVFKCQ